MIIDFIIDTILFFQMEAAAVNLVAAEEPADVYSEIAARYGTRPRRNIFVVVRLAKFSQVRTLKVALVPGQLPRQLYVLNN